MAARAYFINDSNAPSPPAAVYQFDSTDGGVTWTSPSIYYNATANPPPDLGAQQDLAYICAGANSPGVTDSGILIGVGHSTVPGAHTAWGIGHAVAGGANAASLVDALNCIIDWNETKGVNEGPWKVGTTWFLATVNGTSAATQTLRVYSSTDFTPGTNSGTWVIADSANSPITRRTTGYAIYFDSVTGIIYCGITAQSGSDTALSLVEFNCNFGVWNAPHDPFTFTFATYNSVTIVESLFVYSPSVAKWFLYFQSGSGSSGRINYATFDGATWTTDLTMNGSFPHGIDSGCMILDPDGTTLHSWISVGNIFGHFVYTYCRVDTTGPSVTHTATSPNVNSGSGGQGSAGRAIIDNGVMMFPYVDASNFGAYVWVSPSLTSPAFTANLVCPISAIPSGLQFEESALAHISVTPVIVLPIFPDYIKRHHLPVE